MQEDYKKKKILLDEPGLKCNNARGTIQDRKKKSTAGYMELFLNKKQTAVQVLCVQEVSLPNLSCSFGLFGQRHRRDAVVPFSFALTFALALALALAPRALANSLHGQPRNVGSQYVESAPWHRWTFYLGCLI